MSTRRSSLRIAVLYTPLTQAGGGERQMLEEVVGLRRLGHIVTVLTFALDRRALLGNENEAANVTVLPGASPVAKVVALRRTLRRGGFNILLSHTSFELTGLATLHLAVPVVQYHSVLPSVSILNPYLGSRRYQRIFRDSLPAVVSYDAVRPMRGLRRMRAEFRTRLKHLGLRRASAVVVLSRKSAAELKLLHGVTSDVVRGCLPSELVTAGPPTLPRPLLYPEHGRVVLSVCRLDASKRIDLLLRAFVRVKKRAPDVTCVLVGKGPEQEVLRELARSLGLGDSARFAGFVSEEDLAAYFAGADVFASPAMADFNISPYEALAYGCHAVWTTEMETDRGIENSGRVFVAEPDEESLARQLLAALDSPLGPLPDLRGMTWEARARLIEAICYRVVGGTDGRQTEFGSEA
ncbi:MAG: glycosyltransferase [Gaiellaceae bacterium]